MAAGLLKDPIVTPNTLEKVIDHVLNSPYTSSNEHQQIPVHIVVPGPSKYNSISIFLQVWYCFKVKLIILIYFFYIHLWFDILLFYCNCTMYCKFKFIGQQKLLFIMFLIFVN